MPERLPRVWSAQPEPHDLTSRLQRLRSAFVAGTYHVPPELVADAMLHRLLPLALPPPAA